MASRREFLQAGIAASVLPLAVAGSSIAPVKRESQPEHHANFYKVIFDERFPASVAYGDQWTARGAAVHAIHGDITDLWFHDLDHQWKKQPVAIAGLTAHGPLFCLERLAWDHGMRVISRVEQDARDGDGEPLISWVIAPKQKSGVGA
jgi:hypothetical protein